MIKVHIEHLVLEGLPVEQRHGPQVKAAVEEELSRLIAEGGLAPELASGGAVPSVRADRINSIGKGPAQIGKQIARSVYRGMNR
jgi:hypothetical protein